MAKMIGCDASKLAQGSASALALSVPTAILFTGAAVAGCVNTASRGELLSGTPKDSNVVTRGFIGAVCNVVRAPFTGVYYAFRIGYEGRSSQAEKSFEQHYTGVCKKAY